MDTKNGRTRNLKLGTFSILTAIIAIAIVAALNVAVSRLPTEWTHIDLSANELLSISEETRTVVSSLSEDVTLYYLVQPGNEDMNTRELLDRYDEMSEQLSVVRKDPLLYPGFASQYTDEALGENSVIVESAERFLVITQEDIYVSSYTYDYDNYTYYTNTQFEGENAITGAIDFVTNPSLPVAYCLSGHGETELPADLARSIERQNIELAALDLLTVDQVPQDAACIIIAAPMQDISAVERDTLLAYQADGGCILLITGYGAENFENLMALPGAYGAVLCPGLVREGSASNSLSGYSHYLLPDLAEHDITAPMRSSGYRALLPNTQGILLNGSAREGLTVSPLLTTSDSAFSKVDGLASTTLEREDKDISGPFMLGAAFTQVIDNETSAKLIFYPCSMILDSETDSYVAGGNYTLLINSLGWMCSRENAISIHGKSVMASYLTVPAAAAVRWNVLFIGVLPAILLISAAIIWYRRKRA